jgi:hypothetical protein
MWTPATRSDHDRDELRCPSDLTDPEWSMRPSKTWGWNSLRVEAMIGRGKGVPGSPDGRRCS